MSDPQIVSLERVAPEAMQVLENLVELYVHDLSEIFEVEIGADGRFGYEHMPRYGSEPDRRFSFFIRSDQKLAGFALVTRGSPVTRDPEHLDVAEFFVLRRYRRTGLGSRAAFLLWNQLRGHWVVRVSEANREALPFWRKTVRQYTSASFSESKHPGGSHGWNVFEFETTAVRAAAPGVP